MQRSIDAILIEHSAASTGLLEFTRALIRACAERGDPVHAPAVIALAALRQPADADAWREAGVQACLPQPATPREIQAALRQALSPHDAPPPSAAETLPAAMAGMAAMAPAQVLLVEDNAVNELLTVTMLRRWGHEVTVALDGEQAVALHAQRHFDIVFMDVHMPGMSGLEATRRMRAQERSRGRPHMPIVALTASAMESDRRMCLDAGMNDHLAKPLRASEMLQALERYLSRAQTAASRSEAYRSALEHADAQTVEIIAAPFLLELPKELAAMRAALEGEDIPALARRAHSLKGLLLAFGAKPAASLAEQLQRLAQAAAFEPWRARACLDELAQETTLFVPHLRAVAQRQATQASSSPF